MIAVKTPESKEKFAQKILEKNSHKWGIYRPQKKYSRWQQKYTAGRPVRSTVQRSNSARWQLPVDRPDRPKQIESSALRPGRPGRSTVRSLPNVHRSVHVGRSTRSTDFKPSRLGQKTSRLVEAWNSKPV